MSTKRATVKRLDCWEAESRFYKETGYSQSAADSGFRRAFTELTDGHWTDEDALASLIGWYKEELTSVESLSPLRVVEMFRFSRVWCIFAAQAQRAAGS